MDDDIVTFVNPPVVEVVAGVSFVPQSAELGPLLSAFWKERLRDNFPKVQQQPPYSPRVEPEQGGLGEFGVEFGGSFPWARLWATSRDDDEVLQLQPGWFACNWRRLKPEHEYDRWPRRRETFSKWYRELDSYLAAEGVSGLAVTQCEVTYINHIQHQDAPSTHAKFANIFRGDFSVVNGVPAKQVAVQMQHSIAGVESGTLYTKISPAIARDGRPLYVLDLTARAVPTSSDLSSVVDSLDLARREIDTAFVAITSGEMHREWGMQNGG